MGNAGECKDVWRSPNVLGIVADVSRAVVTGTSLAMQQRTQECRHISNGQAVPLSVSCEAGRIQEALRFRSAKLLVPAN